ncbi:SGNH/GDSL hydrolase family protein [Nocardia sp. CDC153]|uniref:SGNH/GDSL hydrolase family protein n=1 Tax=Nocardia sp. CDC153 TaxID=3112167 RepID=UPI002DB7567E|nr:SGNH/GDSL hydrolase family protein [Nocardia sp. CDC153]MEC3957040.1 SGNH/GDSL hydrolase family protein [Nocardia sp. CDC153]
MTRYPWIALCCAFAAAVVSPGAAAAQPISAGARYVALGSSYASGPGLPDQIDGACQRSAQNYPHQVARALDLDLVDVSCGGATTADILERAQRTAIGTVGAPQIEAVSADTRLVTVSIGGNDLNLVGSMVAASGCAALVGAVPGVCENLTGAKTPTRDDFDAVERAIGAVVDAVHTRAPEARVLLIDYLPALDRTGDTCATAPMRPDQAATARHTYDGLLDATQRAGKRTDAVVITIPDAEAHTACSPEPWVSGLVDPLTTAGGLGAAAGSYHPNLEGTTRIARQILDRLDR